jgi:hypothetical protein
MREDMYKVIVERPRKGGLNDGARQFRNDDERGGKIGMKQGYHSRKGLNENLAPLKRWLASQVNRPWDKVYAELCANIDRRNTVQEHIFAHIDGFVERNIKLIDGDLYVQEGWRMRFIPLKGSQVELYVHPRTGLLLRNRHYVSWSRQHKNQQAAKTMTQVDERRVVSSRLHLRKLDGVWYAVTLADRPTPEEVNFPDGQSKWKITKVWDAVERKLVTCEVKRWQAPEELIYAKHKRQLSGAELRQYQLANDNAGETRRCRFWGLANIRGGAVRCYNFNCTTLGQ